MAPNKVDNQHDNEAGKSQRVKKKEKQRRHSDRQKDLFELKGTFCYKNQDFLLIVIQDIFCGVKT